jgi:hypothetical protein
MNNIPNEAEEDSNDESSDVVAGVPENVYDTFAF